MLRVIQRSSKVGGLGGVEGWGEKADNCNWITINFFLKVGGFVVMQLNIPSKDMKKY